MPDVGSILNVVLAVGLFLVLALAVARLLSGSVPAEPTADPLVDDGLGAGRDTVDEIERARLRSMLTRR